MSWIIFFWVWVIFLLLICLFVGGASLATGFDDDEDNSFKNHG